MALQPNAPTPNALIDAQGRVLNSVLIEHARQFTLQYLRHTIQGESMDQELIEGSFLGQRGKPSAVPHHPDELIERPTHEEYTQYGYLSGDLKKLKVTADGTENFSDYLEKYFKDHYVPAREQGLYKDIFDMQRATIMMAMDRVLDSVQSRHADDYAAAEADLKKVVAVSIRIIHPKLVESGMKTYHVQQMMENMYDEAVALAIRNRVEGMTQAEQATFWGDYEAVRAHHLNPQPENAEPGLWHRQEQKGDDKGPALQLPKPPYTARVRVPGREVLDRGHRAILMVGNDNEERSR